MTDNDALGKILADYNASQQRMACLKKKMAEVAQNLTLISNGITGKDGARVTVSDNNEIFVRPNYHDRGTDVTYPTLDQVTALIREVAEAQEVNKKTRAEWDKVKPRE